MISYPDYDNCLERLPCIEPRALGLFVKNGREKEFETLWEKYYGSDFILLTKSKVTEKQLFGRGENAERFESVPGDYLAVAAGGTTIFNDILEKEHVIGVHAGLTPEELTIPLIAVRK